MGCVFSLYACKALDVWPVPAEVREGTGFPELELRMIIAT